VALASLSLFPIGAAFSLPVFALAVRRFTHPTNRAFAFSFFYVLLCASGLFGGLLIYMIKREFWEGRVWFGWKVSWMRVDILAASALTLYTCFAVQFVRNAQLEQDVPLPEAQVVPTTKAFFGLRHTARVVLGSKSFWSLLVISLIVSIGTRTTFRHLDATFPKYFTRIHGEDAPFEIFISIQPLLTVLLGFPVTFFLLKFGIGTYKALMIGCCIQSLCPIALFSNSMLGASVFISIMALGESIWAPALYEYSTMAAPEGFEGTYVAVTFIPQYVSAAVVGVVSGVLLDRYVPDPEEGREQRPVLMWAAVSAMSFLTPLLLYRFRDYLFDSSEDKAAPPPHRTRAPDRRAPRTQTLGKYETLESEVDTL